MRRGKGSRWGRLLFCWRRASGGGATPKEGRRRRMRVARKLRCNFCDFTFRVFVPNSLDISTSRMLLNRYWTCRRDPTPEGNSSFEADMRLGFVRGAGGAAGRGGRARDAGGAGRGCAPPLRGARRCIISTPQLYLFKCTISI